MGLWELSFVVRLVAEIEGFEDRERTEPLLLVVVYQVPVKGALRLGYMNRPCGV